jgi:hypothetical protein
MGRLETIALPQRSAIPVGLALYIDGKIGGLLMSAPFTNRPWRSE